MSWAGSPGSDWRCGEPRVPDRRRVEVRRVGTPFDVTVAVSTVKSYGEGPVMIWFLEDYRDDVILVVRVQHFELADPTG
jgi:hypothetical protein